MNPGHSYFFQSSDDYDASLAGDQSASQRRRERQRERERPAGESGMKTTGKIEMADKMEKVPTQL